MSTGIAISPFVITEFVRVETHAHTCAPDYGAHVVASLLDAGVTRILSNDRSLARFSGIEVVPLQG